MRRRGFTLIEVLISIALVGMLLGSMFVFLFDMLSTRRRVLDHAARRLAAATLIEHLESELTTCLVGDGAHGAGIEGHESDLVHRSTEARAVTSIEMHALQIGRDIGALKPPADGRMRRLQTQGFRGPIASP